MDERIFLPAPMNLREDLLRIPFERRFAFDERQQLFFVNLERFAVRGEADIEAIRQAVHDRLAHLGRKVHAIVNYDEFDILPELMARYSTMVRGLTDRYYSGVSRYTTSGFLRIKLGEALQSRGVAPHIFETAEAARDDLRHMPPG